MASQCLPGQNFECSRCGRCCRGVWSIEVDAPASEALRGSDLLARLRSQGPVLRRSGTGFRAEVREGHCVFLSPDRLCGLHSELGEEAKPAGCRQFPLLAVDTPDGRFVGASFYCPAVQANAGPPLAGDAFGPRVGFEPLPVAPGRIMAWSEYRRLEGLLLQAVEAADPASALERVLVAVARGRLDGLGPVPATVTAARVYMLASVVASVECEAADAPALTRQILHGDRVRMPRFGWEGDPGALVAALEGPPPEEVRRYLRALIFRKMPALDRPVLDNLVLLSLLPWLCAWYTTAAGGNWSRAVEWLEMRLVTHATGFEPLLASLAEAVRNQCRVVRPPWRRSVAAAAAVLLLGVGLAMPGSPPPQVALVVEEPPGRLPQPAVRHLLSRSGAHATFLLDLEELPQGAAALAREGHAVGAVLGPQDAEPRLLECRTLLSSRDHVELDLVQPGSAGQVRFLERDGFEVVDGAAAAVDRPEEADRLAREGLERGVLVVRDGPCLDRLVEDLVASGARIVPLRS